MTYYVSGGTLNPTCLLWDDFLLPKLQRRGEGQLAITGDHENDC